MKHLRIPSLILALCLIFALLATPALAAANVVSAPDAENGIYYVDQAQCLSQTTKDYLSRQNIALTNACGGQVAVVTLEFLNDLNSEEYAYEVMNQWGVGDKDKNNGTVFVLVTAEKKCWITSGSGIENDLSAGRLEQILEENCYDSLDSGRYDEAVYDTVRAVFDWYEDYYGINLADYSAAQVENGNPGFGGGESRGAGIAGVMRSVLNFIIVLIVLIVIVVLAVAVPRGPRVWFFGPSRPRAPRPPRPPHNPGPHHNPGPRPGGGFGARPGGAGRSGGGFGGGHSSGHSGAGRSGGSFGGASSRSTGHNSSRGSGGFKGGGSKGGFGGGGGHGGGGHGGGAGRR